MNKPKMLQSRGFSIWMRYQAEYGRITLDEIAKATGLDPATVRRFLAEHKTGRELRSLYGAAIGPCRTLCRFLKCTMEEMVFDPEEAEN